MDNFYNYLGKRAWVGITEGNMEYTKEQVDQMIKDATKGLMSKDEFDKELARETDRRVNQALDTHKSKWQEEAERKAKMTAEELAKEQLASMKAELDAKSKEIALKQSRVSAIEKFNSAGLTKEQYEDFLDVLVKDDEEVTNQLVDKFTTKIKSMEQTIESKVKESLAKVPPPSSGGQGKGEVTTETFAKMTYEQRLELKAENPELFKQLVK
jgi:hypothetical protein